MNKSLLLSIFLFSSLLVAVKAQTGIDCATAVTASIGTNAGNGNSTQYFKFTATSTGYLNLYSSSTSYCRAFVYKENCDQLASQVVTDNCYKGSPLLLYVESGSTYYIKPLYLYSNNLIIESTDVIGKEITSSYIELGSDYFNAVVDTVNNTLSYTVPDNADLTNVTYNFERLNYAYTTLSVNGSEISGYGTIDLSTLSSILITGKDGSTATYTVNVIKKTGISCTSATPLIDTIKGNGEPNQYYSFTPDVTSYYELITNRNSFSVTTYMGSCGSLTTIAEGNVSATQKLYLYGEAASTYYITTYNQKTDSLIIKKVTQLPKEFTTIYVSKDYEQYYAAIDTVKNTISISVPSNIDLTSVNFYFYKTGFSYTTVSTEAGNITSGADMDISNISSLKITANDGSVATYSLTIKKVEGLNCESAKVITEEITAGNGNSTQYYSYTPETTKYITIAPNKNSMYAYIYSGACDNLTSLYSGYIDADGPMELKVEAGTAYTIQTYDLDANNLIIRDLTSITKEFRYFDLQAMNNSYYSDIDTVKNTITVSVPSDMDLSSVNYYFSVSSYNLTSVSADGNVLDNSGTADFRTLNSLLITADDGTTQTYALIIKKVEGMNCNTAKTANYGLTPGNGSNRNYFTFTPAESGFVSMYPSGNGTSLEVYSGTCDNLTSIYVKYAYASYPLIAELEGGKTYTIKADYMHDQGLIIRKLNSLSKEFDSFEISDYLNYFYAKIDTVNNTLTFTIPSDLDLSELNYDYDLTLNEATEVSVNGTPLPGGGKIDLTQAPSFTITAKDGTTAVYTLNFVKDDNLNCATSTPIEEGTITGNGKSLQYFTYTPSAAGFLKLTSDDYIDLYLLKGECGSFNLAIQGWIEPGKDLLWPVEAEVKYTILSQDQGSDKFNLAFLDKVSMDFSFFRLRDYNIGVTYYSEIDTVLNTITIKVPAGWDKTNLMTDFRMVANQNITVTANDATVENDTYIDFTNISSLTLTGKDNASVTYSLNFVETPGANCETATALTEGTITGSGTFKQYFTLTASKSGYMKVSALDRYFYMTVAEGTCSNLNSEYDYNVDTDSPLVFKVEKDKQYTILAIDLQGNKFNISSVSSVSKELLYASLYNGNARYYGTIDTTAKTISFTVSEGVDLTLVNYSFGLKDENNTHIVAGTDSIANYGFINLNNLNSLTIKGNDGTSVTYSVSLKTTSAAIYRVDAYCGENGTISPNGIMSVEKGTNLVFTITPKSGYAVKELYVDEELVTPATTYTFTNVSDAHSIEVTFEKLTNVEPIFDFQVSVYPNPFKNNFTVEAKAGTLLTVYNAQGARILENIMDSNIKTINLTDYPQGLYIIEIRKGEKAERYKAVKQ